MRYQAVPLDSSQELGGRPVEKNGRKFRRPRRHDRESSVGSGVQASPDAACDERSCCVRPPRCRPH